MEGSDIAVPRIIAEILKLAFSLHWLDESGERLLGKCRWHIDGGGGGMIGLLASFVTIINFDSKIFLNAR